MSIVESIKKFIAPVKVANVVKVMSDFQTIFSLLETTHCENRLYQNKLFQCSN